MEAPPVQYVATRDGWSIAYTVTGAGQPMIFFPPGFESVHTLWRYYPEWMRGLAARFRLICFDARGEGLSQRGLPEGLSLSDLGLDLEAVTDRFKDESFVFYACGARGHDAVRFALKNPGRVRAMIWNIASIDNSAWPSAFFRDLSSQNWLLFLDALAGHSTSREERRMRAEDHAACVNLEDLQIFIRVQEVSSVEDELQAFRVPLLVLHPRDFPSLPVEESMKVAARATNARFVPIDGDIVYGDAGQGFAAIDDFIASLPADEATSPASSEPAAGLSTREIEVLRLVAAGRSNQQIADELVISVNTVNRHVSNIYAKTGSANRAEAATYAARNGIV